MKASGAFPLCRSEHLPHGSPSPATCHVCPLTCILSLHVALWSRVRLYTCLGFSDSPTRMFECVSTPTPRTELARRRCPLVRCGVSDEFPNCTWTAGLRAICEKLILSLVGPRSRAPAENTARMFTRAFFCTLGKTCRSWWEGGRGHLIHRAFFRDPHAVLCSLLSQGARHVRSVSVLAARSPPSPKEGGLLLIQGRVKM